MSSDDLTPFSYVVLTLVGSQGAGPHDIVRMMRQGSVFWTTSESHFYAEPKRLAKLGYLDARKEPGKTRERTVYTLTEKGRSALADYARTSVSVTPVKSDALLRLLICDLVGTEVTRKSLATLRDDVADLRRRLDQSESSAAELPHRTANLRIVLDFLRGLLDLHEELVERVDRELTPIRGRRPRPQP